MKIILFLIISFFSLISSSHEKTINKSVAYVNDEVITLFEISLYFQTSKILSLIKKNKKININEIPYKMKSSDIKLNIEKMIILELLFQELRKFNIDPVSFEKAFNNIKPYLDHPDSFKTLLAKLNTSEKLFLGLLSKRFSADLFLQTKFTSKTLFVTENEVNQYIHKNNLNEQTANKDKIKASIKKLKNSARISTFISNLFERSNIKYIPFEF